MAKIDTYHSTQVISAFTLLNMTGTQEAFGAEIDTLGAESLQIIAQADQLTDGTYTITLLYGDESGSVNTVVPSDFVLNSPIVLTSAHPYGVDHAAYLGDKRLAKVRVNSDSAAATASIAVTAIIGKHWHEPVEGDNSPTG